jgi:hypothetical protein
MKWRRLRKWAKWACTLAAAVIVGAAVFSLFSYAIYAQVSSDGKTARIVAISGGRLGFQVRRGYDMMGTPISMGWSTQDPVPWSWGMTDHGTTTPKWHGGFLWYGPGGPVCMWGGSVTLLYPFLLTTIPAALLWYRDRRHFGPGLCPKCGYDRAGLAADATCPECGAVPSK